jgi:uncharacterized protein
MKYTKELEIAKQLLDKNKVIFKKIKKNSKRETDELFHKEHERVFKSINCLNCANCCKTTSPIFRDIDIKRIAKKLKTSEKQFIENNLKIDEDNDYVLKKSPCLFLNVDNTCEIYEDRPLACKEYPHTDRKNMFQILDLTINNSLICPAVSLITQKINSIYEKNSS